MSAIIFLDVCLDEGKAAVAAQKINQIVGSPSGLVSSNSQNSMNCFLYFFSLALL